VNRRIVLLDIVLVLFAAGLIWLLRAHYSEARAHERAILRAKVPPKAVLAPPPQPLARPAQPADYADIAQRMLFSKDRNPNVVVEAPKPAPEPPMPALPIYHGQMAIGEPVALLSLPTQQATQKAYHAGEKVGDFKLVAFDNEKIELEWNGKKVERKPEELAPKEPAAPAAAGNAQAPAAAARPAAPVPAEPPPPAPKAVTSLASSSDGSGSSNSQPSGMGEEIAPGARACLPGDTSPAGTVLNGYTKRNTVTMFGAVCRWEQPLK